MQLDFSHFPAHIINGSEIKGMDGDDVVSQDPFFGKVHWQRTNAKDIEIDSAVESAKKAFPSWRALPFGHKEKIFNSFISNVESDKFRISQLISEESGKPAWEALQEVNSLIGKMEVSIKAYKERCSEAFNDVGGKKSFTRFKPHGVMAVIGPYNFPLTMANGHIMPSLVAGNTVVFKPSELTPLCGIVIAQHWQKAGLPQGVLNCICGNGQVGRKLSDHKDINGVLFVGSHAVGLSILSSNRNRPERMIALEMGGNSPLMIQDYDPTKTREVLEIIIQSSFITSGQRCSSARRLLVNRNYDTIIEALAVATQKLQIGHFLSRPEPFYGPMIRPNEAMKAKNKFDSIIDKGGEVIVYPQISGPNMTMMSPGIVRVDKCRSLEDEEIFGPIIQIRTYDTFEEGIDLANDTKFGLAAGLVSKDASKFREFYNRVDAGILNWNQQLTGATKFAPFGGIKNSGNFRPAGYLSADYCSYATASFEVNADDMKISSIPGLNI